MACASDRNGSAANAKKRRSGPSGKSNWQKFNCERSRKKMIAEGLLPGHRLHGKQPALAKKRSGRVVQKAIRVESPSPVRVQRSGRVVQKAIRIESPSPVTVQRSGRVVQKAIRIESPSPVRGIGSRAPVQRPSRIDGPGYYVRACGMADYVDADDEPESVLDAASPSSEEEAVEEDGDNGNGP